MKTRQTPKYWMIFDTETTGLPKSKTNLEKLGISITPDQPITKISKELKSIYDFNREEKYPTVYPDILGIDEQPYITQLSYVIVDEDYEIVFCYNEYIKLPEHVEVTSDITNKTGITKEICQTKGVDIVEALKVYISWFFKCDRIVGHNINFDKTLIRFEIKRHYEELLETYPYLNVVYSNTYDRISALDYFDTMIRGNRICGIMIPKKTGEGTKLKPPKLEEMYKIFFHKTPKNLHNSMVDVLITMRCYLKLLGSHRDVDDSYFEDLVKKAVSGKEICGHLTEFA